MITGYVQYYHALLLLKEHNLLFITVVVTKIVIYGGIHVFFHIFLTNDPVDSYSDIIKNNRSIWLSFPSNVDKFAAKRYGGSSKA